jgi:hypothetical protein
LSSTPEKGPKPVMTISSGGAAGDAVDAAGGALPARTDAAAAADDEVGGSPMARAIEVVLAEGAR